MAKIAKNPAVDPTLPKIEIKLGGESYFLCFNFGALILAESKLRALGIECNLLKALDLSSLDATRIPPLLYGALITHDPNITFEQVSALVTMKNLGAIFDGLLEAYADSLAEPSEDAKADPQKPE